MRWFGRRRRRGEIDKALSEVERPFVHAGQVVGAHHAAGQGERQNVMLERMAARTDRGLRRENNQDCVLAHDLPNGAVLAAVADGVGGTGGGEVASSTTIQTLLAEFTQEPHDDPAAALGRAFQVANQSVRARATEQPDLKRMATTLVAALVHEGAAWIANVGDSRGYLFHQGELRQLTRDHTWVSDQVRAGRLTEDEAKRSDLRNIITRGIGVSETVEPDLTGPVSLPTGSLLILCSDGLHGVASDSEIAAVLESGSPSHMAEQLIDLANRAGGPDNVSAVIVSSGGNEATDTLPGEKHDPVPGD